MGVIRYEDLEPEIRFQALDQPYYWSAATTDGTLSVATNLHCERA
ncbi:hypothetical protein ACFLUT_03615 [Chloroflexota bacterium]